MNATALGRRARRRIEERLGRPLALDAGSPLAQTLEPYVTAPMTWDGLRYTADGPVPSPFHYRWLIPAATDRDPEKMAMVTRASLLALPLAMRAYTGSWKPGLMLFGLHHVWRYNWVRPVLVDAPAMLVAVAAAAATAVSPGAGIALSLLGGTVKETVPLFAAAFAWSPWPLVGLVVLAARWLQPDGSDPVPATEFAHQALEHPFQTAWFERKGRMLDPKLWVLPWGLCLLALHDPSPQVLATLALAYAQCLRSTDTPRLYQWAWPVMAAAASKKVPKEWFVLALLAHTLNPWRDAAAA